MKVKCPTCQQDVEWSPSSEYRPFCSKKCQLIDLGEWAGEEKVISSPAQESDINNLDPEDIEAMLSEQHSDFFKHQRPTPMIANITIVGGTHGNETSGIQLVRNWQKFGVPEAYNGLNINCHLSNMAAIDANVRFVEEDLNRQFTPALLARQPQCQEARLAHALNQQWGPKGESDIDLLIDIHNTTSAMGATLIILQADEFHIQLARYVKQQMPEANILVEDEKPPAEHAYLCSIGKRGIMIEVGAQPQGVLRADVYDLTERMALAILDFVNAYNSDSVPELPPCDVFRFIENITFPLNEDGERLAMIHPALQDNDFAPVSAGEPVFLSFDGQPQAWQGETIYPHFINEAAYHKLHVAFATASKAAL